MNEILVDVAKMLLNGLTLTEFIAYYIAALFGMLISLVLEIYSHREKINLDGGFVFSKWMKENKIRVLASIVILFAAIIFSEALLQIQISVNASMFIGFTFDKIVESFNKKRK